MSNRVKNQHYVPRMYLSRMCARNKRIDIWDIRNDRFLENQSPKKFAAKKYYYDITPELLRSGLADMIKLFPEIADKLDSENFQIIEKMLGRSESDIANILRDIDAYEDNLFKYENKIKITIFLYELAYRTEAFRDSMENIHHRSVEAYENLGIPPERVKKLTKGGKDTQINMLLSLGQLIKSTEILLNSYGWYYAEVKGTLKLLISDDPARGVWLGFNDICLPIANNKAIVLRIANPSAPMISKDMPDNNKIVLSERSVMVYNLIQCSYANRFMFGDVNSMAIIKRFCDSQNTIPFSHLSK